MAGQAEDREEGEVMRLCRCERAAAMRGVGWGSMKSMFQERMVRCVGGVGLAVTVAEEVETGCHEEVLGEKAK
jgi:hypothetical protein